MYQSRSGGVVSAGLAVLKSNNKWKKKLNSKVFSRVHLATDVDCMEKGHGGIHVSTVILLCRMWNVYNNWGLLEVMHQIWGRVK